MAILQKNTQYRFRRATGFVLFKDLLPFAQFIGKLLGIEITADGLDIRETSKGIQLFGKGIASTIDNHPFKVGIYYDEDTTTWYAYIANHTSYLFDSLDHTSAQTIVDLTESFPVTNGDSIWLEIEFDTWPSVYTATIKAGDFSATSGEVETDGGFPSIQTYSRIVLATFESDGSGGVKIKDQLVRNNLQMKMFLVGGLPVNYPVARP